MSSTMNSVLFLAMCLTVGDLAAQQPSRERRVEVQAGVVRLSSAEHRDASLDAHGAYVGLRLSEGIIGARNRVLLAAGGSRTGGESSYSRERYSSYVAPVTAGLGYLLRRSVPTVEAAFHAGFAYERLTVPDGRTSEQVFGSTDAANGHWRRYMASELLVRHDVLPRLLSVSVAVRVHHGTELALRAPIALVLGLGLPR